MISLTHDLNRLILTHVDRKTYENVRKVCKYFRDLTSKDPRWVSILKLAFKEVSDTPFATLLKKKVVVLKGFPQTATTFPPGKAHVIGTNVAIVDHMRSVTLYNHEGKEVQGARLIPRDHTIISSRFTQKEDTINYLPKGQKFRQAKFHGDYVVQSKRTSFAVYSTREDMKKILEISSEVEEYTLFGDYLVYSLVNTEGFKNVKIVYLETGEMIDPFLKWPDHEIDYDWEDFWIIEHNEGESVLTNFIKGMSYPLDSRNYRGASFISSRYVSLHTNDDKFSYYDLKLKKTVHTNLKSPDLTQVFDDMFFHLYGKTVKVYHPEERRLYSLESDSPIKSVVSVKWPFVLLKTDKKFQIYHLPSSKLLNEFDSTVWIFRNFQDIFFKKEGQPIERRVYPIEI